MQVRLGPGIVTCVAMPEGGSTAALVGSSTGSLFSVALMTNVGPPAASGSRLCGSLVLGCEEVEESESESEEESE